LKTNARNHPHNRCFFRFLVRCLSLGSPGVHQTQIWAAIEKVWEPLI